MTQAITGLIKSVLDLIKTLLWEKENLKITIITPETITLYDGEGSGEAIPMTFQVTNRSYKDNSVERLEVSIIQGSQECKVGVWLKEQLAGRPLRAPSKESGLAAIIDIDLPLLVSSGHSLKLHASLYVSRATIPEGDSTMRLEFRDAFKKKHPALISLWDGELLRRRLSLGKESSYVR